MTQVIGVGPGQDMTIEVGIDSAGNTVTTINGGTVLADDVDQDKVVQGAKDFLDALRNPPNPDCEGEESTEVTPDHLVDAIDKAIQSFHEVGLYITYGRKDAALQEIESSVAKIEALKNQYLEQINLINLLKGEDIVHD